MSDTKIETVINQEQGEFKEVQSEPKFATQLLRVLKKFHIIEKSRTRNKD